MINIREATPMITPMKHHIIVPLISAMVLAGCVSQSKYDALQEQNQQLQSQLADSNAQIARLHEAIKYTVNSDLLFSSGGWQRSVRVQQVIAKLAQKPAPTQQNKTVVSGTPTTRRSVLHSSNSAAPPTKTCR